MNYERYVWNAYHQKLTSPRPIPYSTLTYWRHADSNRYHNYQWGGYLLGEIEHVLVRFRYFFKREKHGKGALQTLTPKIQLWSLMHDQPVSGLGLRICRSGRFRRYTCNLYLFWRLHRVRSDPSCKILCFKGGHTDS